MEKILMDRACRTHGERKLLLDRFVETEISVYMFMKVGCESASGMRIDVTNGLFYDRLGFGGPCSLVSGSEHF
jgi:hypothetical protein